MKKILLALAIILAVPLTANASSNPCKNTWNLKKYRALKLNARDTEACFQSITNALNTRKHKKKAIVLMAGFLYSKDPDYRKGAILELGNSSSAKAIAILKTRGREVIRKNQTEDITNITTALISLNGYTAAIDLAKFSKRIGKRSATNAIRDEFLTYTSGPLYSKMVRVAGEPQDFDI